MSPLKQTHPTRSRIFYGWWIVIGAFFANTVGGGVSFWSFGIFFGPLETEFGWTRAQASGAVSLGFLVAGIIGPWVGRLVDRHGARSSLVAGSLVGGLCLLLLAGIRELWQYYALQIVSAFARTFSNYIPVNSLVSRWFVRRRGAALGLSTAGFMFGGVVFVPLLSAWIEAFGWRLGYLLAGTLLLLAYIPFSLLLVRNRPQDINLEADGGSQSDTNRRREKASVFSTAPDISYIDAIRRPDFWALSLAFALFFMAYGSFQVHSVPFFRSAGLSVGTASLIVSGSSAIITVLRLVLGFSLDRIRHTVLVMFIACGLLGGSLVMLSFTTAPVAIGIFVATWSVGGCFGPLMESLMLSQRFGLASFGALLGTMGFVEMFGFVAGPWIGGYLFDRHGSYDMALLIYAGALAVAVILFLFLSWFKLPRARVEAAPA